MVNAPRPSKKAQKIVESLLGKPPAKRDKKGPKNKIFEVSYPTVQDRPITYK
jgi:hypothetical protein